MRMRACIGAILFLGMTPASAANSDLEPHAAGPSSLPAVLGAIGAEPADQGVVEGGEIPYQPWAEHMEWRFARSPGRRYAGGRFHEFHRPAGGQRFRAVWGTWRKLFMASSAPDAPDKDK